MKNIVKNITISKKGSSDLEQEILLLQKAISQLSSDNKKLSITNISGLNYLGRSKRPPTGSHRYNESEDSPSVKFTKMIAQEFRKKLNEKIEQSKQTQED